MNQGPKMEILISVNPQTRAQLQGAAGNLKMVSDALKNVKPEQTEKTTKAVKGFHEETKHAATETEELGLKLSKTNSQLSYLESSLRRVAEGTKFLAGGFLGIEVIAQLKDIADIAARSEEMAEALKAIGNNAGYTSEQVMGVAEQVEKMGFTVEQSRQFLTRYLQANLDLSKATQVAALAQNLSVSAGQSYTQTLDEITYALQSGYPMMLRRLGLQVDMTHALQQYAAAHHTVVAALTQTQRTQATLDAVLVAGAQVQGLYKASLNTVAGQLKLLPVMIENLKDTLGQSLLPAYLAVVQAVQSFVQQSGLAAEADAANTTAAQEFGKEVGHLADALLAVGKFFIDHRKAIMAIVGAWILVEGVIEPGKRLIIGLGETFVDMAEGAKLAWASLMRFGEGVSAAIEYGGAIVGLAKDVSIAEAAQLAFSDLLKVSGLTSFVSAIKGAYAYAASIVALATTEGVGTAATQLLTDAMAMLDAAFIANPIGLIIAGIAVAVAGLGLAAYELLKHVKGLVEGATWIDVWHAGLKELKNTLSDVVTLAEVLATLDFSKLNNLKTLNFKSLVQEAKDERTKSQQAQKDHSDANTAAAKAANAKRLANEQEQQAETDLLKGGSYLPGIGLVSGASSKDVGELYNLPSNLPSGEVRQMVQNAAKTVQTAGDLQNFKMALDNLRQVKGYSGSIAHDFHTALAVASEQVRRQSEAFAKPLLDEAKQRQKEGSKALEDSLDHEMNLQKTADKELADEDKAKYEQGKLSLQDYYDDRRAIMQRAFDEEYALANARIAGLVGSLKFAQTPEERAQIQNQINEQQNKRDELSASHGADMAATYLDQAKDQYEVTQEIEGVQRQMVKDAGGLSGELEEINHKYDELLKKTHGQGKDIIEAARQAERFKAIMDQLSKSYDTINSRQKAMNDLTKAQIESAAGEGTINDYQKQQLENQLLGRQQGGLQGQIGQNNDLIAQYQRRIAELKNQFGKDYDTTAYNEAIDDLKTKNIELQTQIIQLGDQIKTYGDQVRDSFTNSVSTAISGMLTDMRHAQNALVGLGKNLQKTFADMFAKRASSAITQWIIKDTTGKDGNSVFDKLGNLLGFGQKVQLGETAQKPVYSYITNLHELLGGGSYTTAGSGLKSLAGSIPTLFGKGNSAQSILDGAKAAPLAHQLLSPSAVGLGSIAGESLQSIAIPKGLSAPVGGAGAGAGVHSSSPGGGPFVLQLHPDFAKMTLDEWFGNECARAYANR